MDGDEDTYKSNAANARMQRKRIMQQKQVFIFRFEPLSRTLIG